MAENTKIEVVERKLPQTDLKALIFLEILILYLCVMFINDKKKRFT